MPNTQHTLVAVFNDNETARKAQDDLVHTGFSSDQIQLTTSGAPRVQTAAGGSSYAEAAGGSSYTEDTHEEGGISGFFHRLFGGDEEHSERGQYDAAIGRGNSILTITVNDSQVDQATRVLDRYDPVDIDERGVAETSASTSTRQASNGDSKAIPVVEEDLQVGKRTVQRGGVRVYSRVTEQPVQEDVTLREEHVRVERRPVDRAATAADFANSDEVIEMVETAEEPVVAKRARVVEEVLVGKDSSQRTEAIRDTVRRTDVQVERIPAETSADFERDYQSRYGASTGSAYDDYQPAYEYGYSAGNLPANKGKSWDDIQDTVKTDYMRNNPTGTWDRASGAIRYGWEKATGKR